jgi:hypothetical protein
MDQLLTSFTKKTNEGADKQSLGDTRTHTYIRMLFIFKLSLILVYCMVCAGDALISSWQQTCKVHVDSSHAERKKAIQEQEKFNVNNWAHWGGFNIYHSFIGNIRSNWLLVYLLSF